MSRRQDERTRLKGRLDGPRKHSASVMASVPSKYGSVMSFLGNRRRKKVIT